MFWNQCRLETIPFRTCFSNTYSVGSNLFDVRSLPDSLGSTSEFLFHLGTEGCKKCLVDLCGWLLEVFGYESIVILQLRLNCMSSEYLFSDRSHFKRRRSILWRRHTVAMMQRLLHSNLPNSCQHQSVAWLFSSSL